MNVLLGRLGGRGLYVGDLLGYGGLPVVDMVYFPTKTGQAVNLSIKTANGESTNGINFVSREVSRFAKNLPKLYSAARFSSHFELLWNGRSLSYRNPSVPARLPVAKIKVVIEDVLGLRFEPRSERRLWLLLDLTANLTQSPTIFKDSAGVYAEFSTVQPNDLYLRVTDSRVDESRLNSPKVMNLSYQVRKIKESYQEGSPFEGVMVLFADSTLIFGADGINFNGKVID